MSDLFRIFAALIIMYLQALSRGPFHPTVAPTATPSFTATAVWTNTATPTLTFTSTSTPVPSATTTPTSTPPPTSAPSVGPAVPDPTGFDVAGAPPAQTLPSAIVIYPLLQVSATQETRIELVNLTNAAISVQCFFVNSGTCNEIDFFLSLTASQPLSWTASTGLGGNGVRVAPPFVGEGELKCVVRPSTPDLSSHNALQGRALISDTSDTNDQVIGYSAIGFRRLTPGAFTGSVSLDGVNYEQCPDRLHFEALTSQSVSDSQLVLVPCSEDLENQIPSATTVQFSVINELEAAIIGGNDAELF